MGIRNGAFLKAGATMGPELSLLREGRTLSPQASSAPAVPAPFVVTRIRARNGTELQRPPSFDEGIGLYLERFQSSRKEALCLPLLVGVREVGPPWVVGP
jgi:hypothetical protein